MIGPDPLADDTHTQFSGVQGSLSYSKQYPDDVPPTEDLDVEIVWEYSPYRDGYEIKEVRTPDGKCWFKSEIEVIGEPWSPAKVVFRITYNPEGGIDA